MTASYFPDAEWLNNGLTGGTYIDSPWRVVLHTTETEGIPNYSDGATAPHLTYVPATRKWYQHTNLRVAARALRNGPDPVQTNRQHAIQVEIACYSNKPLAYAKKGRIWVGDLTQDNLTDLAGFLTWCRLEFGVDMVWPGRQALSYAEANAAGFRLTVDQWAEFAGVCGHQHVPDSNTHWDPGGLDWDTLMALVQEDDMPDPRFDDDVATFLNNFAASVRSVDSDSSYPRYLIPWYRKWKGTEPDDVDEADEVDALEEQLAELKQRVAVLESEDTPTSPSGTIVSGDIVQIFKQED